MLLIDSLLLPFESTRFRDQLYQSCIPIIDPVTPVAGLNLFWLRSDTV